MAPLPVNVRGLIHTDGFGMSSWKLVLGEYVDGAEQEFHLESPGDIKEPVAGDNDELVVIHEPTGRRITVSLREKADSAKAYHTEHTIEVRMMRSETEAISSPG